MKNEMLLVQQMTGEQLISTIRLAVENSIEKKLAPVISVLKKLENATIERKEAAEMLGVSPMTVSNYVTCGKLSPIFTKGSSHMKYKLSEVLALLKV